MDLQHLRASDGTGEAVLAHIQTVRTPGSTVLDLDNVDNWNSKAVIITGTPAANGFISPAGMKVMYGHLSAGDFIIDGYAPGYVDNGNTTSEVAIVKMTTSWADTLVSLLGISLENTGFLKTTSLDHFYRPSEVNPQNFIVPATGVVAVSAGLITTMSNIVGYISGLRFAKTAIANRTWGASKDGYADIDAAGTVTYTEVANGAASPALVAGRIRVAKVITGAASITSITQYGVDSLNNLIYNTKPFPPAPYSSQETLTGEVWVDGRPVYRKVVRGQVNLINGSTNVAHGITGLTAAWELLRCSGGTKYSAASNSGGQVILNSHREAGGNWNNIDSVDQTNIQWVGSFGWGNSYFELVLEYVK